MKIQLDDKMYVLENIKYRGSRYVGECTFTTIGSLEERTRITFNADFSMLMSGRLEQLEDAVEKLRDENNLLKNSKLVHYKGYFRDAATHGVESLEMAAIAMVSDKENELSEAKKQIRDQELIILGLKAKYGAE